MATVRRIEHLSIDDYLQGELHSEVRHEYIDGQTYAMVGASKQHNLIIGTLYSLIRPQLRTPCRAYFSDVKVRIKNIFYYPDLVVSCASNDNPYYETDPVLIIEVLSPTTESKDCFEKRIAYQSIDSLQEYAVVAQDKLYVDIYRRTDEDWIVESCRASDTVLFHSIGLEVSIDQIYQDVMRLP